MESQFIPRRKKEKSRPEIVTYSQPEKQHFINNYKNKETSGKNTDGDKNPFILLVGDSMTKNINSYDLRQKCKGTKFMVRSLRGGKIKNIKNLIIDTLEDITKPDAICIHVSSNGNGRSVDDIEEDLENLITMVKRQGIQPIMSMVVKRNDRYGYKVREVNQRLTILCLKYNIGYVEHENIKLEHLNAGGIHISNRYGHLVTNNFSNYFNYAVQNEF